MKSSLLISCVDVLNSSTQTFSLATEPTSPQNAWAMPATVFPQLVDHLHSTRISLSAIHFLLCDTYWPLFWHVSWRSERDLLWQSLCCEIKLNEIKYTGQKRKKIHLVNQFLPTKKIQQFTLTLNTSFTRALHSHNKPVKLLRSLCWKKSTIVCGITYGIT